MTGLDPNPQAPTGLSDIFVTIVGVNGRTVYNATWADLAADWFDIVHDLNVKDPVVVIDDRSDGSTVFFPLTFMSNTTIRVHRPISAFASIDDMEGSTNSVCPCGQRVYLGDTIACMSDGSVRHARHAPPKVVEVCPGCGSADPTVVLLLDQPADTVACPDPWHRPPPAHPDAIELERVRAAITEVIANQATIDLHDGSVSIVNAADIVEAVWPKS